jgi:hypothetical protein
VINSVGTWYGLGNPLNLAYAFAGQGSFLLLINGRGFTPTSVVEWNGSPLPTHFGATTDIAADVSSTLIAIPGKATVRVRDGAAVSSSLPFALVSAAPDGSPANGDSLVLPSISSTGRYVAFQSNATNLAPGPASGFQEIYLRDTCIGAPPGCVPSTVRITVTHDGSPVNGHSRMSAVSADGRYVAFDSSATNILPNSQVCGSRPGLSCVYVRDTCIGASSGCTPRTLPVSVDVGGALVPGSGPVMTPDARFISFGSSASVLELGTAEVGDIFLRDTCLGVATGCSPSTRQLSFTSSGSQGNGHSVQQALSVSGRFLAFLSYATNMVPNQGVKPGIFWRDTCLGATSPCTPTTLRVDVTETGAQPNDFAVLDPFPGMSADGRLVAFGSGATNLVSGNVPAGNLNVRDTCNGAPTGCTPTTFLASVANDGSIGNCGSPGHNGGTSMSADGRFVAFGSIATNLTPDDNFPACGWEDIFVRDTCFGVTSGCTPSTVRVSVANFRQPGTSANSLSSHAAMSADGHYVVFLSSATNLLLTPTNGRVQVFLAKTGF